VAARDDDRTRTVCEHLKLAYEAAWQRAIASVLASDQRRTGRPAARDQGGREASARLLEDPQPRVVSPLHAERRYGAVRRAVVHDDQLQANIRLLQDALYGPCESGAGISDAHDHRDLG
jgi:hypothetical protein